MLHLSLGTEKKPIQRVFYNEEVKLFGQFEYNAEVEDLSVTDLIAVNTPKANVYVPHTAGRYQKKRFRKATCPIIERITNALMKHGRNNGKKNLAIAIVRQTLEIISLITGKNPLETILKAISIAGPREDSTRIGSGGAVKKSAVDVSPLRRVNMAIYLITAGARESSFRNIDNIAECLANEFIQCASGGSASYALKKKEEIERSAKSNR